MGYIQFSVYGNITMSATVSFTGYSSILTSEFHPHLELERGYSYSCGLLEFTTYNSVHNVTKYMNRLFFKTSEALEKSSKAVQFLAQFSSNYYIYYVEVEVGAYELKDIANYLKVELENVGVTFSLTVNEFTQKCTIKCSDELHFNRSKSIHHLFGYKDTVIQAYHEITGDYPVSITTLNTIVVECDIVSGSYTNGKPGHSIHEFTPTVAPGFKIIEVPKNIVYLPINRYTIQSIEIRIRDQDGNLIDFQNEKVTCRIHIKRD